MNNKKDNKEENDLPDTSNFFISYNDVKNNKSDNSRFLAFSSTESGPPSPDDKPVGGGPPSPDDKPVGGGPPSPDDKPVGGGPPSPDDKPVGGGPPSPDDKPVGGGPPSPDDKPVGGGPPSPDDKPVGGGPPSPDDKPVGGGPPPTKYRKNIKHKINNEISSSITKIFKKNRVGHINKKIIYSAIGIIAVAVIIMIFSQESDFKISPPKFNQGAVTEAKALEISLKNVSVANIDNNNIKINTIFDVYNPNEGTLILENINYNINLDKIRIASGEIGTRPEGFVDSQEGIYPIIGNGTVTLKDQKTIEKDNRIDNVWNKIADESSSFQVNGSFAYKQTSTFQAHGGEIDFSLKYP